MRIATTTPNNAPSNTPERDDILVVDDDLDIVLMTM